MALEIINPSHHERVEDYRLAYHWRSDPGAGFSFPCDAQGDLIPLEHQAGRDNYNFCVAEAAKPDGEVIFDGLRDESRDVWIPAEARCPCGRTVWLEGDYGHGIDCDCGRIYNMSGQELAPRSQWEEPYDEDDSVGYNVRFGYAGEDY